MKISEALAHSCARLANIVERPRLESEILLAHYLQKERIYLHAHGETEIEEAGFFALVAEREKHVPIEYITKKASFYGEEFFIDYGALIPRPETELLIDLASEIIEQNNIQSVLEIGVGSGIISATLKGKFPNLSITACDISDEALAIAQKNFALKGIEIPLIRSDLFQNIDDYFELVVSNPPYIKSDYPLPKNLEYEPQNALFGGESGDEILLRIIDESLLRGVRFLACEMGYDQREKIAKYLDQKGIANYNFYKDLSALDRGFWVRFH